MALSPDFTTSTPPATEDRHDSGLLQATGSSVDRCSSQRRQEAWAWPTSQSILHPPSCTEGRLGHSCSLLLLFAASAPCELTHQAHSKRPAPTAPLCPLLLLSHAQHTGSHTITHICTLMHTHVHTHTDMCTVPHSHPPHAHKCSHAPVHRLHPASWPSGGVAQQDPHLSRNWLSFTAGRLSCGHSGRPACFPHDQLEGQGRAGGRQPPCAGRTPWGPPHGGSTVSGRPGLGVPRAANPVLAVWPLLPQLQILCQ